MLEVRVKKMDVFECQSEGGVSSFPCLWGKRNRKTIASRCYWCLGHAWSAAVSLADWLTDWLVQTMFQSIGLLPRFTRYSLALEKHLQVMESMRAVITCLCTSHSNERLREQRYSDGKSDQHILNMVRLRSCNECYSLWSHEGRSCFVCPQGRGMRCFDHVVLQTVNALTSAMKV